MTAIEILALQGKNAYVEMTTQHGFGRQPTITQGSMSCSILSALTGRDVLLVGQILVLGEAVVPA